MQSSVIAAYSRAFFLTAVGCVVLCSAFVACRSGETTSDGGGTETSDGGFQEDQPQYPEPGDDPFFHEDTEDSTAFRVLIRRGNYEVRQVQYKNAVKRKEDPVGDREQMQFFHEKLQEIDFIEMTLEGTIEVRLSPINGQIEHITYVNGKTPRTWQASKYFQDDVSRFRFEAPNGGVPMRRFRVEYRWRIDPREGMSEEERKRRAVEWLKQQTR